MNIDAVAEVICDTDPFSTDYTWVHLEEEKRDGYRRMAQAAIEAMGLTEEKKK